MWQRIMEKIVKASIQVMMSAFSMTCFSSVPLQEHYTTGKLAEDVVGRVETTGVPPNEL